MLSEKDRAVVYSMCLTGMDISVLIKSFPQFDKEDIESIYNECKTSFKEVSEGISISCNCS